MNRLIKILFSIFLLCLLQFYAYRDCRTQEAAGAPQLPEGSIHRLGSIDLSTGSRIHGLSVLPGGKTVATADEDKLTIWNLESGRKISSIDHAAKINATPYRLRSSHGILAVSPNGKSLGIACGLGVHRYDLPFVAKQPDKLPFKGLASLESLSFSPSSQAVFGISTSAHLFEWRVTDVNKSGSWIPIKLPVLKGGEHISLDQFSFSVGGGIIAIGGNGGRMVFWDTVNQKELGAIEVGFPIRAIGISADGKALAVATDVSKRPKPGNPIPTPGDGMNVQLEVYALPDLKRIIQWDHSATYPYSIVVAVSSDGALMATITTKPKDPRAADEGSYRYAVELFETKTGKLLQTWLTPNDRINLLDFLPDGSGVVAAGPYGVIHYWDSKTGKSRRTDLDHIGPIAAVQFTPQGGYITASVNGTVRVWDDRGKVVKQFTASEGGLASATLSRDGKTLFTGGSLNDGNIRAWEVETGIQLRKKFISLGLGISFSPIPSLALSPDGKTLAASVPQKGVVLLDPETLKERKRLKLSLEVDPKISLGVGDGIVALLAYAGDNRLVTRDDTILQDESILRFWDTTKEEDAEDAELWKRKNVAFKGRGIDRAAQCGIAVSPSGKRFAAPVNNPKVARIGIWETEKGKYVDFFDLPKMSNLDPTAVVYTSETTMAVGDMKGKIWLLDLEKKGEPKLLEGHQGAITCLTVSSDGKLLPSGSTDTTALIWKLPKP